MNTETAKALASDRVIDITTTGRQTGEPRRIEIWFHRVDGRYYITGTPGRPRSWYANLVANPAFTFHLKESATADLPATARPVTDPAEREQVLAAILASLPGFASNPGQEPAVWVARSPLVEVTFDD
jgi:deazaflavin-dependent oxidoreductase (nitroreductase family)